MDLVIGGNSEIGRATVRHLKAMNRTVLLTSRRPSAGEPGVVMLDFDRPMDKFEVPEGVEAAAIFVAVARLAACESDPGESSRINCMQTLALVDRLVSRGVYTLFLSTNQVFDGRTAHVPADAAFSPVSVYGLQKARTEGALKARMDQGDPIGILRLAKVVSPGMALIEGWKRDLSKGRRVWAFSDMTMAPTPTDLVTRAITRMMIDRVCVVAQLTGPRDVAYAEVGRFVARELGADEGLVVPTLAAENGMPAGAAPDNTTLDNSYLSKHHGLVVPDAFEVLRTASFVHP